MNSWKGNIGIFQDSKSLGFVEAPTLCLTSGKKSITFCDNPTPMKAQFLPLFNVNLSQPQLKSTSTRFQLNFDSTSSQPQPQPNLNSTSTLTSSQPQP